MYWLSMYMKYRFITQAYTALRLALMIVVTTCQILRLKCTEFDFGWGSAPDPAGGAYSAPPDSLAGFKGAYF